MSVATVLLLIEAASLMCLMYIPEARSKSKDYLVLPLICFAAGFAALCVAFVAHPDTQKMSAVQRLADARKVDEDYRSTHRGAACPQFATEVSARLLEFQAFELRRKASTNPDNAAESWLAVVGAVAAMVAGATALRLGHSHV